MTSAAINKDSDRNPIILESGTITNYNQLINQLTENGYVRVSTINELGEFSVKGDIIDIFPNGYKDPIICPGGEIGRRKGLKIPRWRHRAGSSPAPGTIKEYETSTLFSTSSLCVWNDKCVWFRAELVYQRAL